MRQVANAVDSLWGLIGGTIILAAGVSLIEFSCTAGFPVLWTNLLTSQNVTAGTFLRNMAVVVSIRLRKANRDVLKLTTALSLAVSS